MRFLLLLLLLSTMAAATDVLTVDATSQVVVNGAQPTTPAATEVRIGGGRIATGGTVVIKDATASALSVTGGATLGNAVIGRASQAAATEAVRGDDPRLSNARLANGGNADTVGGQPPANFIPTSQKSVANGVAPLDASGKVPAAFLPPIVSARGMQVFQSNGTFTVPAGVTQIQVILLGGGGGGGAAFDQQGCYNGNGGNAGAFAWVTLTTLQPSYVVTIGGAGASNPVATAGGTSSFGSAITCTGGGAGSAGNALNGPASTATSSGVGLLANGAIGGQGGITVSAIPVHGGAGIMLGPNFGSGGDSGLPGSPGICIVTW